MGNRACCWRGWPCNMQVSTSTVRAHLCRQHRCVSICYESMSAGPDGEVHRGRLGEPGCVPDVCSYYYPGLACRWDLAGMFLHSTTAGDADVLHVCTWHS